MGLSGLFLLSELNEWINGEEIEMTRTERWLSLPAGHAGGKDDASDSALPSFWVEVKQGWMQGTKDKDKEQKRDKMQRAGAGG